MNVMLWKRHQGTDLETAKKMLAESHRKVMEMAAGFTNEELFTKKYYNWTGTTDLGAYFVSTCSSHKFRDFGSYHTLCLTESSMLRNRLLFIY